MAIFNGKVCCNCQYWDGNRKVSAFKDKAEVKSSGERGICLNNKCANARGRAWTADHADTCHQFQKWDKLK